MIFPEESFGRGSPPPRLNRDEGTFRIIIGSVIDVLSSNILISNDLPQSQEKNRSVRGTNPSTNRLHSVEIINLKRAASNSLMN